MKLKTSIPLTGWKREFQDGELIPIKGHGFSVVKITKRGLALRHVKSPSHSDTHQSGSSLGS